MGSLKEQLAAAEAKAERLRLAIAAAPCRDVGHRWKLYGGRACCCELPDGSEGECSFSVYVCEVCQDCDYGDNPDNAAYKEACKSLGHDRRWLEEEAAFPRSDQGGGNA